MADWDDSDFMVADQLLNCEWTPLRPVAVLLEVTEHRIKRGGIFAMHTREILSRVSDEGWVPVPCACIVQVDDFLRWVRENRPRVYEKFEAVLVDRAYRRGLR